jgi:hypothetical protein
MVKLGSYKTKHSTNQAFYNIYIVRYIYYMARTLTHNRNAKHSKNQRTRSQKGGISDRRESKYLTLATDGALNTYEPIKNIETSFKDSIRSDSMYAAPGDTPQNVPKGTRSVKSMVIERKTNRVVLALILGGFALGGISYAITSQVIIK